MIQEIPESTLYVDMICTRAMAKVTSQECLGQNDRKTHRTSTTITDALRDTCTDAHGSTCTDKHTHGITSRYDCRNACTKFSTKSMGMNGSI